MEKIFNSYFFRLRLSPVFFTGLAVLLGITGFCFPWIMSCKNIALSIACVGLVCFLNWRLLLKEASQNSFCLAGIFLFLWIGSACFYSDASLSRALPILAKYRRLLYPIVLIPFFTHYPRARFYFMHGLFISLIGLLFLSAMHYFGYLHCLGIAPRGQTLAFPFINPIYGSFIVAVGSYFAFLYAVKANIAIKARFFYFLVFLSGSAVIFFLQAERVGYYVYSLMMFYCCATLCVNKSTKNKYLVIGIGVAFLSMLLFSGNFQKRTALLFYEAQDYSSRKEYYYTSIGERLHLLEKGWGFIQQKPIIGWGTGSFASLWAKHKLPYMNQIADIKSNIANPHNQFLLFGVELGFVGLFALAVWLFSLLHPLTQSKNIQKKADSDLGNYPLIHVSIALIGAFSLASWADAVLFLSITGDFFVVVCSWVLGNVQKFRKE